MKELQFQQNSSVKKEKKISFLLDVPE